MRGRRGLWGAVAALAVLSAAMLACQERVPGAGEVDTLAMNLLLISLDTTRADHLSGYGYWRKTSPRIDALAAGGHRFEAAYTVIPSTLPSHAVMFTSLFPTALGVRGNEQLLVPQAYTLAERLRTAGFATGAFVSSAPLDPATGIDQGFNVYSDPDDHAVDRAVAWLGGLSSEQFFCFVHLFDPHTRYLVHPELPDEFTLPPGAYPGERGVLKDRSRFTAEHVRRTITAYDGEIRFADAEIGRLLAALAGLRLREKTIVVLISDHGETLDEMLEPYGYGFDHGEFLYRRELWVPLVVWLPEGLGGTPGSVTTDPVSTLDLMPTLLDLVGLSCEAPCEGRSLVPFLRGGTLASRPVISERRFVAGNRELSVLDGRWHWIHADPAPDELYDLGADPDERHNVIQSHLEVVDKLRPALRAWEERNGSRRWPLPTVDLDPALREQLEALGYLGEDAPAVRKH